MKIFAAQHHLGAALGERVYILDNDNMVVNHPFTREELGELLGAIVRFMDPTPTELQGQVVIAVDADFAAQRKKEEGGHVWKAITKKICQRCCNTKGYETQVCIGHPSR